MRDRAPLRGTLRNPQSAIRNWSGSWLYGPKRSRSEERRVGKECRSRRSAYQAEDGIRDVAVTGVQTCALPISPTLRNCGLRIADCGRVEGTVQAGMPLLIGDA